MEFSRAYLIKMEDIGVMGVKCIIMEYIGE